MEKCYSSIFQRRLDGDDDLDRSCGLRSLQETKNGTFVIEYVGELITMNANQRRFGGLQEDDNSYFIRA